MFPAAISVLCLIFSPGAPVEAPPSNPELSSEKLAEDFALFRRSLEEGHAGLYRYTTKAAIDDLFGRMEVRIKQPMSALDFFRGLVPIVAAIRCGHTSLQPPADIVRRAEEELFPYQVRVIDRSVYIFRDLPTPDDCNAGCEIRAVNGVSIDKILAVMLAATPGDGRSATARPYRIGDGGGFESLLWPVLGLRSPFDLTYRDKTTGREQTTHVKGSPRRKIQERLSARYPRPPSPMQAANLRFLDDGKIAVLKIHGFGGVVGFRPLRKFFDQAFQEIHDKSSAALIIDVRDNDGGAHELAEQVFSYLADKQFLYYRDLVLNALTFSFLPYAKPSTPIPAEAVAKWPDGKFHHVTQANWGMQQPRQPHFGGKVYILMNGGSFSSTCEFLSAARSHKKATFIGQESGGSYSGNTSGMKYDITLPNSKLVLRVPTVGYYMEVNNLSPFDRGILPDYAIHHSIADLLSSVDKDMNRALDLARGIDRAAPP